MYILLANLTYTPHVGGVENSFKHLSRTFQKQGFEVCILCSDLSPDKNRRLKSYEEIEGVKVFRYRRFNPSVNLFKPFVKITDLVNSFFLAKKLDYNYNFRFSVVRNSRIGTGIKIALRKKVIISVLPSLAKYLDDRKLAELQGSHFSRLGRLLYYNKVINAQDVFFDKFLLKNSSLNIVFSENMVNQVERLLKKRRVSLKIIPPGVDCVRFSKNSDLQHHRAKSQIKHNDFVFLILGRLIKAKGIDIAIRALGNMKSSLSKLLIVGEGPERLKLEELAQKMGLSDRVVFLPKTLKPEIYYSISDCFLMTSRYESFGQTILEAMSCELPVIGFKTDGVNVVTATEEIIEHPKNGLLCKDSHEDLAEAMDEIFDLNSQERQNIGRVNRAKVIKNYSWVNLADFIVKFSMTGDSKGDGFS